MPKNTRKGVTNRERGKNENDFMRRELDGKKQLCQICDELCKKVWINFGNILLVGLCDYQRDKGNAGEESDESEHEDGDGDNEEGQEENRDDDNGESGGEDERGVEMILDDPLAPAPCFAKGDGIRDAFLVSNY